MSADMPQFFTPDTIDLPDIIPDFIRIMVPPAFVHQQVVTDHDRFVCSHFQPLFLVNNRVHVQVSGT